MTEVYPVLQFRWRLQRRPPHGGSCRLVREQRHIDPLTPGAEYWVQLAQPVRRVTFPAKVTLSPDNPCSKLFEFHMNAWLRNMFGDRGPPDGAVFSDRQAEIWFGE